MQRGCTHGNPSAVRTLLPPRKGKFWGMEELKRKKDIFKDWECKHSSHYIDPGAFKEDSLGQQQSRPAKVHGPELVLFLYPQ